MDLGPRHVWSCLSSGSSWRGDRSPTTSPSRSLGDPSRDARYLCLWSVLETLSGARLRRHDPASPHARGRRSGPRGLGLARHSGVDRARVRSTRRDPRPQARTPLDLPARRDRSGRTGGAWLGASSHGIRTAGTVKRCTQTAQAVPGNGTLAGPGRATNPLRLSQAAHLQGLRKWS